MGMMCVDTNVSKLRGEAFRTTVRGVRFGRCRPPIFSCLWSSSTPPIACFSICRQRPLDVKLPPTPSGQAGGALAGAVRLATVEEKYCRYCCNDYGRAALCGVDQERVAAQRHSGRGYLPEEKEGQRRFRSICVGSGGGATMGHRDKVFAAWRQCRASGPSCRFLLA